MRTCDSCPFLGRRPGERDLLCCAAGVPFGISLTATRENCEEILFDEFLDFFFEEH